MLEKLTLPEDEEVPKPITDAYLALGELLFEQDDADGAEAAFRATIKLG